MPRLLVVEDNVVNQRVVLAVLRKKNYKIEVAADGREALNLLAVGEAFDLVLMDIQMPVLDGLETTRIIRQTNNWTPLLQDAGDDRTRDGRPGRERCLQAGMNDTISTPIQAAHLIATNQKRVGDAPVETVARAVAPSSMGQESLDSQTMVEVTARGIWKPEEQIERLESAAESHDGATLAAEAKKIAAAADQLTAPNLSECAVRIEMAANRGDFGGISGDLKRLRDEILAPGNALV